MSFFENDRRGWNRKDLDLEILVSLLPPGSGYRQLKINNLSEDGIGLPGLNPAPERGSELMLLIPDPMDMEIFREIKGRVVFADGARTGIKFESFNALSMSVVLGLLGE